MSYANRRISLRAFVALFLVLGTVIASAAVPTKPSLADSGSGGGESSQYLLGIPDVFGMNVYNRPAVQIAHTTATGTSFRSAASRTYEVRLYDDYGNHGNWTNITESSVFSHKGGPGFEVSNDPTSWRGPYTQIAQGSNLNFGPWTANSTEYTGFIGWIVEDVDDLKNFMEDQGMVLFAEENGQRFAYYKLPNQSQFRDARNILFKLIDDSIAPSSPQANQTPANTTAFRLHNVNVTAMNQRAVGDQLQKIHGLPYNEDYLLPDIPLRCFNADGSWDTTHVNQNNPTDVADGVTREDLRYVITEHQETQIQIEHNILTGSDANPIHPCDSSATPTKSTHRLEYHVPGAPGDFAQQLTNAGMRPVIDVQLHGLPPQFLVTRWRGPGGLYYEIIKASVGV